MSRLILQLSLSSRLYSLQGFIFMTEVFAVKICLLEVCLLNKVGLLVVVGFSSWFKGRKKIWNCEAQIEYMWNVFITVLQLLGQEKTEWNSSFLFFLMNLITFEQN